MFYVSSCAIKAHPPINAYPTMPNWLYREKTNDGKLCHPSIKNHWYSEEIIMLFVKYSRYTAVEFLNSRTISKFKNYKVCAFLNCNHRLLTSTYSIWVGWGSGFLHDVMFRGLYILVKHLFQKPLSQDTHNATPQTRTISNHVDR